jgi:hypothetical protein
LKCCEQLTDAATIVLGDSCPRLISIKLQGCSQISEKYVNAVAGYDPVFGRDCIDTFREEHGLAIPLSIERAQEADAMEEAMEARSIRLEGQEEGKPQHDKMGVYELMEGKVVNRRAVWKKAGEEVFLYYRSVHGGWVVSDRENMEAGTNNKWVLNMSTTELTPRTLLHGWKVVPGEAKGKCTEDAPDVRACFFDAGA